MCLQDSQCQFEMLKDHTFLGNAGAGAFHTLSGPDHLAALAPLALRTSGPGKAFRTGLDVFCVAVGYVMSFHLLGFRRFLGLWPCAWSSAFRELGLIEEFIGFWKSHHVTKEPCCVGRLLPRTSLLLLSQTTQSLQIVQSFGSGSQLGRLAEQMATIAMGAVLMTGT